MKYFINLFIITTLFFNSYSSRADFIELNEIKVSYVNFFSGGRDPLISYNQNPNKLLDLDVNTNFATYFFWNNKIHSMSDNSQFRVIGLNTLLGLRIFDFMDLYYYHYSQHLLDTATYQYGGGFPLLDGIGINLYLFQKKNKKDSSVF